MAVHVVDLDRHGAEGCGEEVERGDSQPINGAAVCGNSRSCSAPFGTPRDTITLTATGAMIHLTYGIFVATCGRSHQLLKCPVVRRMKVDPLSVCHPFSPRD